MSLDVALGLGRLLLGIILLFIGVLWLGRGSETLARTLGVPQIVIGLTVAAYGTSAPELAVSTEAAADHLTPIALGTVIGACVANISLILGITALIAPPRVDGQLIKREIPILLASVIAVPITLADGKITQLEGGILVACAVIFTIASLAFAGRSIDDDDLLAPVEGEQPSRLSALVVSGLGVLMLVFGSELFIGGARAAAGRIGMSDRMLGMTLVALGTSLPELLTAVTTSLRGQGAIAVGTVVGSNLLNVFLVLGTVALLHPVEVGARLHAVDAIGLVVITLLGIVVLRGRRRISRLEGGMLVGAYVAFIVAASML